MDVHHHPDLHHEPKKWKAYFLEFLMIFLAVTLGFFAESYREYLNDRSKEKEYIKALMEDFKSDTLFLNNSVHILIPFHASWIDSTEHLLQMPDLKGKERLIYQAFITATAWTYDFHPTDRTLSQLHNEGFHLITNKNAADAISKLEDQYKLFSPANMLFQNMQNDLDAASYVFADPVITGQLFAKAFQNNKIFTLSLTDIPTSAKINTPSKDSLAIYIDKLRKYNFYLQAAIKPDYVNLSNEITETIGILRNDYHLENE